MENLKILGFGYEMPKNKVEFEEGTRYRMGENENFLEMIKSAVHKALDNCKIKINDIDLIVCAMATPLQLIPCNAAIVHELVAMGCDMPALDINTSCTSFISAIDIVSKLNYNTILIVSGDAASKALNKNEEASYKLFGEAVTAVIVTKDTNDSGVVYAKQKTWSEGAHYTEIYGGGSVSTAFEFNSDNADKYYFSMNGRKVLKLVHKVLPKFIEDCFSESGIHRNDIKLAIPHQASKVLPVIMQKIGISNYVNKIAEYGNTVSSSVPLMLCQNIENGNIKRGDYVLLVGTAAGLTANFLILKY